MGDNCKKYKMKQGLVKFSKEFVTETGLKEWAGIELPFNEERESGVDALRRAETIVNEYQRSKNYLVQYDIHRQSNEAPLGDLSEGRPIGVTTDDIKSCMDIEVLRSYKFIVRSIDELRDAYQKREKELMAGSYESLNDNK